MEVSVKQLEPCLLALDIKVTKEESKKAIEEALKYFAQRTEVPGFRKGKAPLFLLRRHIGEERLYRQAENILVENAYKKALEEKELELYGTPQVESIELKEDDESFVRLLTYTQPVVSLPPYESIEVEYKEVEISKEEEDRRIEALRYRAARSKPVKRKTVKKGDLVDITFEVYIDGKLYKDKKRDSVLVGDQSLIPPIDVFLEGMRVGEEKDIEVHYPPDFNNPELADKDAVIRVKVEGIKKMVLPEVNDDFVKEVSEFSTLEELRQHIRGELEEMAKREAEAQLEKEIFARLFSLSKVEFPRPMLEEETNLRFVQFLEKLEKQGKDLDEFLREAGKSLQELQAMLEEEARQALIKRLVLRELAKREKITVTAEDIKERVKEIAQANKVPEEIMANFLRERGEMEKLANDILVEKILDFLKKSVKIKRGDK